MQTPLGLGIQRLNKPKALERGRPVLYTLSKAQHTLADNNLEVMLLVPPIAHVSPVNAHVERAIRKRQELPITGINIEKKRLVDGNQLCSWYAHHEHNHGTYRIMGSGGGARRYRRESMVVLLTMIKETS